MEFAIESLREATIELPAGLMAGSLANYLFRGTPMATDAKSFVMCSLGVVGQLAVGAFLASTFSDYFESTKTYRLDSRGLPFFVGFYAAQPGLSVRATSLQTYVSSLLSGDFDRRAAARSRISTQQPTVQQK